MEGRVSTVGVVTDYGLESPGMESRWGWDFPHLSRPTLWPTPPPLQRVPGFSQGKSAGAWRWPSTPSNAEVKERVVITLLPLWNFVACSSVNFTFGGELL